MFMPHNAFQEAIAQWKGSESDRLWGNLEKTVVSVVGIVEFLISRSDSVMFSALKSFRCNNLAR